MTWSAPGKVLWAGEYAVLDGAEAVVCAVARRAVARVSDTPQTLSPFLGALRDAVAARHGEGSPEAAAAGRIRVDSSALERRGRKLGLGSSAAVTVAAAAAALGRPVREAERREIHELAHAAHAAAQAPRGARGSGADIAAAVHGGLLAVVRSDDAPLAVSPLPWPPGLEIVLVWTGHPASTPELVAAVRALRERDPAGHGQAIAGLAAAAAALAQALRGGDPDAVVAAVARGAEAIAELGARAGAPLVPPALAPVAALARSHQGAAKPTGAGGGDLLLCAFPSAVTAAAFRQDAERARGLVLIDAPLDARGVQDDRILIERSPVDP